MSVNTLAPPEEWRVDDERLRSMSRETLKLVNVYLGGGKISPNAKVPSIVRRLVDRVKELDVDDVRRHLPVFLDDLLIPEALTRLQDHCDADTDEWQTLVEQALFLYKDPDGAAKAGTQKLSFMVEHIRPLTQEERLTAGPVKEQREAKQRATQQRNHEQGGVTATVTGGRGSGEQGTGGAGNVGGMVMAGGQGGTAYINQGASEGMMQELMAGQASLRKTLEETLNKISNMQQGMGAPAVAPNTLQPYMDALGPLPSALEGKDRHVIEELFEVLQTGYEPARRLMAGNPGEELVMSIWRSLELSLFCWVFRHLAVQKGFEAAGTLEREAFLQASVEGRLSMIRSIKAKSGKRRFKFGTQLQGAGAVGTAPMQMLAQAPQVAAMYRGPPMVPPGWTPGSPWQGQWGGSQQLVPSYQVPQQTLPSYHGPQVAMTGQATQVAGQGPWAQAGPSPVSGLICWVCGQPGHIAPRCPSAICRLCGATGTTTKACPSCAQARAGGQRNPQ
jgi:hypothetical protein